MNEDILRKQAEAYVETQIKTLAQYDSASNVTPETKQAMVNSAMRAAGYGDDND